jgi:GTPase SAR1 family protein
LSAGPCSVLNKQYENKIVEFALWDTAGQEEYDRLRPLSYPESHVIFICFAVDFPTSLENVEDKVRRSILPVATQLMHSPFHRAQWFPEVSHFCEDVPIVLIATKTDLRRDSRAIDLLIAQGRHPVTEAEGSAVARRIGARYAEVSAINGTGVEEVFDLALKEAMRGRTLGTIKKKVLKCVVV